MRVASFDVDCQKGFTPLCPNELPVPGGDQIVDELNANGLLSDLRVGSKDCHPPNAIWIADEKHPVLTPIITVEKNVDLYWPSHCMVGTYGHQLLDKLPRVEDYDFFIFKGIEPNLHPYGACFHDIQEKMSTGIIEWFKTKSVSHIIVGGLALDYCVKTTVMQLAKAGFLVIVNFAACRAVDVQNEYKIYTQKEMVRPNIYFASNADEVKFLLEM